MNLDGTLFVGFFAYGEVVNINRKRGTINRGRKEGRAEVRHVAASESIRVGACWRSRAYTMAEAITAGWLIVRR